MAGIVEGCIISEENTDEKKDDALQLKHCAFSLHRPRQNSTTVVNSLHKVRQLLR